MKMSRFASDAGKIMVGNIVARAFSAVTVILIARTLSPAVYGQYAASLSVARLSSILFNLGLDAWLLKSGGERPEELGGKVGSVLWVKSLLGVVWLVGITLLAWLVDRESFPYLFVALCATSVWFESIAATAIDAFKSALRNNLTVGLTLAGQILISVIVVGLILLGWDEAFVLLSGRVVATLIAAGGSFYLLWRLLPLEVVWERTRRILRETRAFGVSLGLAMVAAQADVTLVAYFLGREAAGLYAPAITLAMTAFLVPNSIHQVLLPTLSQMKSRGVGEIQRQIPRMMWGALGMGVVLAVPMGVVARPLTLLVYGEAYAFSGDLLTIFAAVMFLRSFAAVTSAILAAVGWQRYRVYAQIGSVVTAVGGNIGVLTMTEWGLVGVAFVYVLAEGVLVCGCLWFVWQWEKGMRDEG